MVAHNSAADVRGRIAQRLRGISALACVLAIAGTPARASTLLTAGKVGLFRNVSGSGPRALVRVTGDPALRTLTAPTCPASSSVGFAFANESSGTIDDRGAAVLPCTKWRAIRSGFRYLDPSGTAGGVREILYRRGRLLIRAGGAGFRPVTGPAIYVEAFLTVANTRYLIRFSDFRRDESDVIVTRRPSHAAAAGEAAFWQTLSGAHASESRAFALLRKAIRRNPRDGRSQFYLGALHLYRAGPVPAMNAGAAAPAAGDLRAAQAPLDRAVELLTHDSVPAVFRAIATYLNGVLAGDSTRMALGFAQFEDAATRNLFFNSTVELFIVPQFVSRSSEEYQVLLQRLQDLLPEATGHLDSYPNVFTSRLVPHDLEGTGLLLGDVAAKGGSIAGTQRWYGIADAVGRASDYPFRPIVDDRVAGAAERVALYQDGDPVNDPPFLAAQGVSPCTYCHYGR